MPVVRGARRVATVLPAAPSSVGAARTFVRQALASWRLEPLTDTAVLLVSELTTNGLLHAGTDLQVQVERTSDGVLVSVLDRSRRPAHRRRHGLEAGTGRGLGLVDALSLDWGSSPRDDGWAKAVWFVLPDDAAALPGSTEGALYGEDWLAMVDEL